MENESKTVEVVIKPSIVGVDEALAKAEKLVDTINSASPTEGHNTPNDHNHRERGTHT